MYDNLPTDFLCVICDTNSNKKVVKILEKEASLFSLVTHGKGTASKKILNYLGLDEIGKAIFFKGVPADGAARIMTELVSSLQLENPGHGIAFTIPISQVCFHHRVSTGTNQSEREDTPMSNTSHHVVLAIFNRGYSEEVMEIARQAGALGGTVLHAHGYGAGSIERFFGISIAPEKEMLMMLVTETISGAIMDHIAEHAGPSTETNAVTFSLPVNEARGLRTSTDE